MSREARNTNGRIKFTVAETTKAEPAEKKETTIVVSRLTKTGMKTLISKAVGNQIFKLREKIEQMKKCPDLTEAATEAVAALTKLTGFVEF